MKVAVAHKWLLNHQFLSTVLFFAVAGFALASAPLQVAAQSAAMIWLSHCCGRGWCNCRHSWSKLPNRAAAGTGGTRPIEAIQIRMRL